MERDTLFISKKAVSKFYLFSLSALNAASVILFRGRRNSAPYLSPENWPKLLPVYISSTLVFALFFFTGVQRYIYEWTAKTSKSSLIWIFSKPIYYTKNPEEIQTVLSSRHALSKATPYKFINILCDSILVCDGKLSLLYVIMWRTMEHGIKHTH